MKGLTVNRLKMAVIGPSFVAGALLGAAWMSTPDAHAAIDCEVRSAAHVAEHGGMAADNAYHIAHGQRPTCDGSSQSTSNDDSRRNDDNDRPWKRDRIGFHCTWRGCG